REREFVKLALITTLRTYEIIFFELMPNILPYIIVSFSYAMMGAIMAETGLRFLGLGPPDIPTLGYLINVGLDEYFNPRLKKVTGM
ncbi:MAG: hypothetical protein DRK00_06675, partial [Thermoprotei archaeon]